MTFSLQVRTYSEWVIDGEYDWPAKCCHCQVALEEGTGPQTTRLGCLRMRLDATVVIYYFTCRILVIQRVYFLAI